VKPHDDERCNCGAGWATFSGHRLDCPRNAIAGRTRMAIERADRTDFALARDRTVHIAGRGIDRDDIPDPADL
jgi:hypothetical protein